MIDSKQPIKRRTEIVYISNLLLRQLAKGSIAMADSTNPPPQVYTSAILLATFSFFIILLVMPLMLWHFRNRNIGASVLVAWIVVLLLFTFINAILWPDDDVSKWYNGAGLCDVEVKVQAASHVALPASFACILRALAAVLDTDQASLIQTKVQRRRTYLVDLSFCVGFPVLQMFFHFIVQTNRYYLYGISGCTLSASASWLTMLLLVLPPTIWVIMDTYFAGERTLIIMSPMAPLITASAHSHSTLPLPPHRQLHSCKQQHEQVPFHAPLCHLSAMDPLRNSNSSLQPLHQRCRRY